MEKITVHNNCNFLHSGYSGYSGYDPEDFNTYLYGHLCTSYCASDHYFCHWNYLLHKTQKVTSLITCKLSVGLASCKSIFVSWLILVFSLHKPCADIFKSPSTQKCALLIVTSLGCLSFFVQNDECAEFDSCFSVLTLNFSLRHQN